MKLDAKTTKTIKQNETKTLRSIAPSHSMPLCY